jgi:AraC-like DNA-binding protein
LAAIEQFKAAGGVGYESETPLGRAFKRCFGLWAGAYRRHTVLKNRDGYCALIAIRVTLAP